MLLRTLLLSFVLFVPCFSQCQRIAALNPLVVGGVTASAVAGYGNFPLVFEANQGQTEARVKFLSHGTAFNLFLTEDEAVIRLRSSLGVQPAVLRMKLLNANAKAEIAGQGELPGTS